MSDIPLLDLAELDAAGALDPDERMRYLARLRVATEAVRAEIASTYEAAAAAFTVPISDSPSSRVRSELLRRARGTDHLVSAFAKDAVWRASGIPGIDIRELSVDVTRRTALLHVRAAPGSVYPLHAHSGAEECFVLSGEIVVEGERLGAGDFHHAAPGSVHQPLTTHVGAEVLLVVAFDDYLRNDVHGA